MISFTQSEKEHSKKLHLYIKVHYMNNEFPVWLRNRLLFADLGLALSQTD